MMNSKRFFRTGVSSIAVAGCVALGATVMVDTYAASKNNFNKQQCKVENGNVRALAIPGTGSVSCVCPSASAASVLEEKQRPAGAASTEDCYIQTPQQITNFNQPPGIPPETPPENPPENPPGDTFLGFNPGNHKNVGKATETPPSNTAPATADKFGVDLNSLAPNGNCCAGGDKGASNGN